MPVNSKEFVTPLPNVDPEQNVSPLLSNLMSPPKVSRNPTERLFTVQATGFQTNEPSLENVKNQSNSYFDLNLNSRRLRLLSGVPIPERRHDIRVPIPSLPLTTYPPTKIPDDFALGTPRLDPNMRVCCTCSLICGGIVALLDTLIVGFIFAYSTSKCCGTEGRKTFFTSVFLAVYFFVSLTIFADVHGGNPDLPIHGDCKEASLKAIHFIILICFLGVVLWIFNSSSPLVDCKPECPEIVYTLTSVWSYIHIFLICFRFISLMFLPNTKVDLSLPTDVKIETADPNVQHIVDTIKKQRQLMKFPSATKVLIERSRGDGKEF